MKPALIIALAFSALAFTAQAQNASPVGKWQTEGGRSHVEIAPCNQDKLCGRIVWLKEPNDEGGQPKKDKNNEKAELRERGLVGLNMLEGFVRAGEGEWTGGKIYNPEDGKTYNANMTLQDANTLRVRGYVGVPLFGKSQTWTRVTQ